MKNENKTAILLSSYNGVKWIPELLESLKLQNMEVKLIVRDDNSNDGSLDLIQSLWENEIEICSHIPHNIGPARSFFHLVSHVQSEKWIAYCDQDDIWHKDKLLVAARVLSESDKKVAMYCSSVNTFPNKHKWPKYHYIPSQINSIFQNNSIGSTIVFTNSAGKLLLKYQLQDGVMHDSWTNILLANFGSIYFDPNPTLEYRLHDANNTGIPTLFKESKLKYLNRYIKFNSSRFQVQSRVKFLVSIEEELDDEMKKFIRTLNGKNSGINHKIIFLHKNFRQSFFEDKIFKFLYLINFFRIT